MRAQTIVITLGELQDALRNYLSSNTSIEADVVAVESHGAVRIAVELEPGGMVECEEFKHRAPT